MRMSFNNVTLVQEAVQLIVQAAGTWFKLQYKVCVSMYDLLLPLGKKDLNQTGALFPNLLFLRIFCYRMHPFKGLLSTKQNQRTKMVNAT